VTPVAMAPVEFSRRRWASLIEELGRRGGGHKESGAFLLADPSSETRPNSRNVRRVVYYDELEAACLTGGITMTASAYDRLWALCAEQQLTVIADIHTHPGRSVTQSPIDQRNPMLATLGHLAFIVPHYAARRIAPDEVGAYEYQGQHRWRTVEPARNALVVLSMKPWDVVMRWIERWRRRRTAEERS
jgi:proteasome lid subunit RPN8/RPN11